MSTATSEQLDEEVVAAIQALLPPLERLMGTLRDRDLTQSQLLQIMIGIAIALVMHE